MNICITNYDTSPQFVGGIKRVSSILAKEWIKKCNVCFLGISPADNKIKDICGIAQSHLPEAENILLDKNIDYFVQFIKENKIDIILHQHSENKAFTELCIKAKERTNVKLVITRHFAITHNDDITKRSFFIKYKLQSSPIAWFKDLLFFLKFHLYKRRKNIRKENLQYKYLINNSDKFVLLSKHSIKDLKNRIILNEEDSQKLYAINNPIEVYEHKAVNKKKRVLWCGRVEFGTKRIDRMLEIWKEVVPKHPDWELFIMGSGNIDYFKAIANKHKIPNVIFTGSCNPYEYYRDGSILCLTSSSESWGMVLVEAQMFGCIPIAYNSYSSLSDIITDGVNGFTIPTFNRKRFAERLEWLMEHDTERENMIAACQNSIKQFDVSIIAQKWIDLFNETL